MSVQKNHKTVYACLRVLLAILLVLPPGVARAQSVSLPVSLSAPSTPPVLSGLKIDPASPFRLDFVLNHAGSGSDDSDRLVRYFLAALTIPETDLWVNLSPYEKDRIIPEEFSLTEMGRDLLEQDYLLKQLTAVLLHPDSESGKAFWAEVYRQAYEKYGTTDIPVDTFNKVWIVPERADLYEGRGTRDEGRSGSTAVAYIVDTRLKVMLEADYLAEGYEGRRTRDEGRNEERDVNQDLSKQILREVIIPVLEREVNEGANFAKLRQIYHSLILAAWYKRKIKQGLLSEVYVDQKKVSGIDLTSPGEADEIWESYVSTFKQGVVNLIREERDDFSGELLPRKYFSGGLGFGPEQMDAAMRMVNQAPVNGVNPTALSVALNPLGANGHPSVYRLSRSQIRSLRSELQKNGTHDGRLMDADVALVLRDKARRILGHAGYHNGPFHSLFSKLPQIDTLSADSREHKDLLLSKVLADHMKTKGHPGQIVLGAKPANEEESEYYRSAGFTPTRASNRTYSNDQEPALEVSRSVAENFVKSVQTRVISDMFRRMRPADAAMTGAAVLERTAHWNKGLPFNRWPTARDYDAIINAEPHYIYDKNGKQFLVTSRVFPTEGFGYTHLQLGLTGEDGTEYPNLIGLALNGQDVHEAITLPADELDFDGSPMGENLRGRGLGKELYRLVAGLMLPGGVLKGKIENEETRELILQRFAEVKDGEPLFFKTDAKIYEVVDGPARTSEELPVSAVLSMTLMGKLRNYAGLEGLTITYRGLQGVAAIRAFLKDKRGLKPGEPDVYFGFTSRKPLFAFDNAMTVLPLKPLTRDGYVRMFIGKPQLPSWLKLELLETSEGSSVRFVVGYGRSRREFSFKNVTGIDYGSDGVVFFRTDEPDTDLYGEVYRDANGNPMTRTTFRKITEGHPLPVLPQDIPHMHFEGLGLRDLRYYFYVSSDKVFGRVIEGSRRLAALTGNAALIEFFNALLAFRASDGIHMVVPDIQPAVGHRPQVRTPMNLESDADDAMLSAAISGEDQVFLNEVGLQGPLETMQLRLLPSMDWIRTVIESAIRNPSSMAFVTGQGLDARTYVADVFANKGTLSFPVIVADRKSGRYEMEARYSFSEEFSSVKMDLLFKNQKVLEMEFLPRESVPGGWLVYLSNVQFQRAGIGGSGLYKTVLNRVVKGFPVFQALVMNAESLKVIKQKVSGIYAHSVLRSALMGRAVPSGYLIHHADGYWTLYNFSIFGSEADTLRELFEQATVAERAWSTLDGVVRTASEIAQARMRFPDHWSIQDLQDRFEEAGQRISAEDDFYARDELIDAIEEQIDRLNSLQTMDPGDATADRAMDDVETLRRLFNEMYGKIRREQGESDSWNRPQKAMQDELELAIGSRDPKSLNLLNLGCGDGQGGSLDIVRRGFNSTQVDFSDEALAIFKSRITPEQADRTKFQMGDMLEVLQLLPAASQDIVHAHLSLQYHSDAKLKEILKEVRRVMKPGGMFLFKVHSMQDTRFQTEGSSWVRLETENHFYRLPDGKTNRFFERDEIERIWNDAGFKRISLEQIDVKGWYNRPWAAVFQAEAGDLDAAQNLAASESYGGIDLTRGDAALNVDGAGQALKFQIDPALLEEYRNASGLDPVILHTEPIRDLSAFLSSR